MQVSRNFQHTGIPVYAQERRVYPENRRARANVTTRHGSQSSATYHHIALSRFPTVGARHAVPERARTDRAPSTETVLPMCVFKFPRTRTPALFASRFQPVTTTRPRIVWHQRHRKRFRAGRLQSRWVAQVPFRPPSAGFDLRPQARATEIRTPLRHPPLADPRTEIK